MLSYITWLALEAAAASGLAVVRNHLQNRYFIIKTSLIICLAKKIAGGRVYKSTRLTFIQQILNEHLPMF